MLGGFPLRASFRSLFLNPNPRPPILHLFYTLGVSFFGGFKGKPFGQTWDKKTQAARPEDGGSEVLAGPSPLAVPGYNRRCRAASHAVATNWCSSFSEALGLQGTWTPRNESSQVLTRQVLMSLGGDAQEVVLDCGLGVVLRGLPGVPGAP